MLPQPNSMTEITFLNLLAGIKWWSILPNVTNGYFKLQPIKMRVETGNCDRFTRYVIRLIWPQDPKSEKFILWALQRHFHRCLRILICTNFSTYQLIRVRAGTAESFFVRPFWPGFLSTIFRQFRQVNCRNSELDKFFS